MPLQDQTVIVTTTDSVHPQSKMREDENSEQPEMFSAEDLGAARVRCSYRLVSENRLICTIYRPSYIILSPLLALTLRLRLVFSLLLSAMQFLNASSLSH